MEYIESISTSIPNGTTEGEQVQFTPQAGNNWKLKWLKLTSATSDYQVVIHEIVDRSITKEFMANNLPNNPDLIPNPGTIESGQDYGFRFSNQSGSAVRITITFSYEIVAPGEQG